MSVDKLSRLFKEEAGEFITALGHLLQKPLPIEIDNVQKMYRTVHSLKSEAMQVGIQTAVDYAVKLEDKLHYLVQNNKPIDAAVLPEIKNDFENLTLAISKSFKKVADKYKAPLAVQQPLVNEVRFSEIEKQYLLNAKLRGEDFFEIICSIDPAEVMVFPRLFLVINKLEQVYNLVKTTPDLDELQKSNHYSMNLYCTGKFDKQKIESIFNIDQISNLEFRPLSYDVIQRHGSIKSLQISEHEEGHSKIEISLKDWNKIVDSIARLQKVVPSNQIFQRDILDSLEGLCKENSRISFIELFRRMEKRIALLGEKLGKRVGVHIICPEGITLATDKYTILRELLALLVQNSVDHGIESPGVRIANGKAEKGEIELSVLKHAGFYSLKVQDDGRGIDESVLREHEHNAASILAALSQPGFSTKDVGDAFSGRGIGLHRVQELAAELGGTLSLSFEPGSRTCFDVKFPI